MLDKYEWSKHSSIAMTISPSLLKSEQNENDA
jgi:hypothetical protein